MNRDMTSANEFSGAKINHQIHHIGEQPRKLMARKNKKSKYFERAEIDDIEMDKHRQSYKRASNKYSSRIQLHSTELIF